MKTYTTVQGDTFDLIAYKIFGSNNYLDLLMEANEDKLNIFVFSAGEVLNIPEFDESNTIKKLPPWRQ